MVLSEQERRRITDGVQNYQQTGTLCLRCNKNNHLTKRCQTDFRACWNSGAGNINDKDAAEDLYQSLKQQIPNQRNPNQQNYQGNRTQRTNDSRVLKHNMNMEAGRRSDTTSLPQPTSPMPEIQVNGGIYSCATDDIELSSHQKPAIMSNYIRINSLPKDLYVYSIRLWRPKTENTPVDEDDPTTMFEFNKRRDAKSAFDAVTGSNILDLRSATWATDYKTLWSTAELVSHPPDDPKKPIQKTYGPCRWTRPTGGTIEDLEVTIVFQTKLCNIEGSFKTKASHDLAEEIRGLNAIISRSIRTLSADLIQVGANKFFINGGFQNMRGGLRAQRGYVTSIRPSAIGPLLNINTATAAFLPEMLVSDFVARMGPGDLHYIESLLRKCTVRITYDRKNINGNARDLNAEGSRLKTFQCFGISAKEQKFYKPLDAENKEGKKVKRADPKDVGRTVLDYFTNDVKRPVPENTLCINVGKPCGGRQPGEATDAFMRRQCAEGACWIPATCLEIVANQMTAAKLSSAHTSNMIDFALRTPELNAALIDMEGLEKLGIKGTQQHLADMQLTASRNLIKFSSRSLLTPGVFGGNQRSFKVISASWNLANAAFSLPRPLRQLHVLGLDNALLDGNKFAKDLQARITAHGMSVKEPNPYFQRGNSQILDTELEYWFGETQPEDCSVIALHQRNEEQYALIKRAADLKYGRHVLCTAKKSMAGFGEQQRLSNLAMKVNLKMQGDNQALDFAKILEKGVDNTIVLGADVTHFRNTQPSIACVRIEEMRGMVRERLQAWQKNNEDALPQFMVFYRDGISESQFADCQEKEITAVKAAYSDLCVDANRGKKLQLTFVICGKRHNTRFYPTSIKDTTSATQGKANGNSNLKPGLYVNKVVTDPDRFNFYLQSHQAVKGTARSTHYHVLLDEMRFGTSDGLPNLTHALCYAFGRATKGVSYAAPAYIADRLCERGRVYLRGWQPAGRFATPPVKMSQEKDEDYAARVFKWKQDMALDLSRQGHWWINFNDNPANGPVRLNPWHPSLDKTMFWM
ncbi:Piwi-domain-containing protein [Amniculicola lignicola CBS 123094]|uniref:Piwi-domain-containing protein n=1 Tax=Amniculicola lignicola CBS 123094 TaxID=1392246 RepID=A0A6A5WWY0_9PLEO|nr:Piwi-domain-containing protein [Amniculicola lignicola CBS 123094]